MKKLISILLLLILSEWAAAQPTANAGIDQTIILPINYAIIYGGFPYSRKSSTTAISSFAWSQISGPNTATMSRRRDSIVAINTQDSVVFLSGMIQGTYQFRLQVTDANGSRADTMQIIVNPAPPLNPSPKSVILNDGVYYPNNTMSALGLNPGDTIKLNGLTIDSTDNFIFGNLNGTHAQPIYIVPVNAKVKCNRIDIGNGGWGSGGDIRFSYVIIDGHLNGVPYNIEAKQFALYSGHHVEGCWTISKNSWQSAWHLGGYVPPNGSEILRFPAMNRVGFYIHDNIVDQPTEEGFYGGPTSLTNQGWDTIKFHPRGDSGFFYNNIVTNTGRDGIQVGGFGRTWIFNNSTYNNGLNGVGGQGSAINFGTLTTGVVENNYMRRSWRNGSFINGYSNIFYRYNYIDSCAFFETSGNAIIYVNSSQHNPERTPPRNAIVENNFVRNPYSSLFTGLSAADYGDQSTTFINNYVWRPNGGTDFYFFSDPGAIITGTKSVTNMNWPQWPLKRVCGPTLMNPNPECWSSKTYKYKIKF
jgi:hypothetical protein